MIKNFLRIANPDIQHRRMTYPPERVSPIEMFHGDNKNYYDEKISINTVSFSHATYGMRSQGGYQHADE